MVESILIGILVSHLSLSYQRSGLASSSGSVRLGRAQSVRSVRGYSRSFHLILEVGARFAYGVTCDCSSCGELV